MTSTFASSSDWRWRHGPSVILNLPQGAFWNCSQRERVVEDACRPRTAVKGQGPRSWPTTLSQGCRGSAVQTVEEVGVVPLRLVGAETFLQTMHLALPAQLCSGWPEWAAHVARGLASIFWTAAFSARKRHREGGQERKMWSQDFMLSPAFLQRPKPPPEVGTKALRGGSSWGPWLGVLAGSRLQAALSLGSCGVSMGDV